MTNKKYEPTNKQLKEIGEADPKKAYALTDIVSSSDLDEYEFTTLDSEGNPKNRYSIMISKYANLSKYDVEFGVIRKPEKTASGNAFYSPVDTEGEVNDPKNLFRVMATVVAAIKKSKARDEQGGEARVTDIRMAPTKKDKSDTRRTNLYKKYIEKEFQDQSSTDKKLRPGVKVSTEPDGSMIHIELPRD